MNQPTPRGTLQKPVRPRPPTHYLREYNTVLGEASDRMQWLLLYDMTLRGILTFSDKILFGQKGVLRMAVTTMESRCGSLLHGSVCLAIHVLVKDVLPNQILIESYDVEDAILLVSKEHHEDRLVFDTLCLLTKSLPRLKNNKKLETLKDQSMELNLFAGTTVLNAHEYNELLRRGRLCVHEPETHYTRFEGHVFKTIGDIVTTGDTFGVHRDIVFQWFHDKGVIHDMLSLRASLNEETNLMIQPTQCADLSSTALLAYHREVVIGNSGGGISRFYTLLGLSANECQIIDEDTARKFSWWCFREAYFRLDPIATEHLATCYFTGKGVEQNAKIGFDLLKEACALGNSDVYEICRALRTKTGEYIIESPGMVVNYKRAFELICLAVESACDLWMPNFKSIPNCDSGVFEFEKFVEFLKSTANDGLTFAIRSSAHVQLLNISKCYGTGVDGLVMNLKKAVIFAKASSLHGASLNELRKCFCCGRNPGGTLYCPCYAARYCNRECQKKDWESDHKKWCKMFKAQFNVPGGVLN